MSVLRGDALSMLKTLPENSVQCIVTSPPYWALRKYDIPDIVFGGDSSCDHDWVETFRQMTQPAGSAKQASNAGSVSVSGTSGHCRKCNAWRGQLGQEPTPDLFIAHLVEIFHEARRVLRPDGVCWLNMGDCYVGTANSGGVNGNEGGSAVRLAGMTPKRGAGLKPKDLVGIPWMLAFALRADGWYLRAENIWAKGLSFCESYAGSVMPESVTDRPTRSHEQVFLLTKSQRYYYDHEAVKEQGVYPAGTLAAKGSGEREGNRRGGQKYSPERTPNRTVRSVSGGVSHVDRGDGYATYDGTRNLRTVWAIGVDPFEEAHFATYPPDLVYPCLKASTSQKGACAACGAPWVRVIDYAPLPDDIKQQFEDARTRTGDDHGRDDGFTTRRPNYVRKRLSERWEPTCTCGSVDVVSCTVLDPFAGSGTTGEVAELLRLRFIGIDLGYHEMSERRITGVAPLFAEPAQVKEADDAPPLVGSLLDLA